VVRFASSSLLPCGKGNAGTHWKLCWASVWQERVPEKLEEGEAQNAQPLNLTFRLLGQEGMRWNEFAVPFPSFHVLFEKTPPRVRPSICLSVFPSAWKNSASNGRILMKFHISAFFFSKICRETLSLGGYIGQTGKSIAIRVKVHHSDIRLLQLDKSALAEYC
jgi:hypothetical protein